MGALDRLPPDQRAVLQLVLQRGRSYDEIAAMLSIDRAAVRQRALDGFDLLGPETSVPATQRALLTDYLLDQLPPRVAAQVLERLGTAPADRAWARVIAGEIAQISSQPLPEIPVGSTRSAATAPAEERPRLRRDRERERERRELDRERDAGDQERGRRRAGAGAAEAAEAPAVTRAAETASGAPPPSSRRGGAILLGSVAAIIVIAVVVVLLVTSGSSNSPTPSAHTGGTTTTATTATTTSSTPLAQADLYVPGRGTTDKKTTGVAEVLKAGGETGVIVIAAGLPSDTSGKSGAYAIWLDNPGGTSDFLGFPNTKVGTNGKLQTEGQLPATWASYKEVLVTLETSKDPKTPGHIVLAGTLTKAAAAS